MSNHTPGPWDYDKDSKEIFSCDEGHGCGWIALVGGNDSNGRRLPDEMRSANCSLIAAAPELLVTLQNCVNVLSLALPLFDDESTDNKDSRDEVESVIDAARAAIAKAEGRGS